MCISVNFGKQVSLVTFTFLCLLILLFVGRQRWGLSSHSFLIGSSRIFATASNAEVWFHLFVGEYYLELFLFDVTQKHCKRFGHLSLPAKLFSGPWVPTSIKAWSIWQLQCWKCWHWELALINLYPSCQEMGPQRDLFGNGWYGIK